MFSTRHQTTLDSFGDIFMPEEAAEPILARPVRNALLEWLTEIFAEKELEAVGIGPRRRAIFDGPPGVGKTTLAHHLAARLGLPMIAVRPERIISKWVGETGWNLGQLFDLAAEGLPTGEEDKRQPIVLFLDEFDAYSRQRRRGEQASDDSRNEEVDTLLQRIEQHKSFVIAATNFGEHIDQAIWRRFDMHLTLKLPGQPERERILARYLSPFGLPANELKLFAESLETASPALIRVFCENIKRQLIIGPKLNLDMRKSAVIDRIVEATHPHPDCGKPRLWSHGGKDNAVTAMSWPLPQASEITAEAEQESEEKSGAKIVELKTGRTRK